MKPIQDFQHSIKVLLTDIDDTLTDEGRLSAGAYQALWNLNDAGIAIVPVTGRPAGWCEMIARQWPVFGVVGENGAFYFHCTSGKMHRSFSIPQEDMKANQSRLAQIQAEVLSNVPGSAVASDQFARINDLAIDFCEDVPALSPAQVNQIVSIFKAHGAHAKVSSIHVNGWFGDFDKVTCSKRFLKEVLNLSEAEQKNSCAFVGDSPNDEPMWAFFPHSFGVANITKFLAQLNTRPEYQARSRGGAGFVEIVDHILSLRNRK
jgi:HAD superfamily hydrolase (TIGR01484 family)